MKALKNFGLGLLWALLLPALLAAVAIVAVFGIPNFFVQLVIMIVNFFRGKKLFPSFEEDEKAYKILKSALEEQNAESKPAEPSPVYVQQNFYGAAPGTIPYIDPRTGAPAPTAIPGVPPTALPGQEVKPLPPVEQPTPVRPELAVLPPYEKKKESDPIEVDVTGGSDDD